jgi:hypothetical protein
MNNIHPKTVEELYKICSINLSPNGVGQVAMSCLVNPPKPGSPSYEQHKEEREKELASLRRRARMVTDGFNSLEDVTCNFTEGAMYSFPQLRLPAKAVAAAKAAGKAPDVFYCLRLLEETGVLHYVMLLRFIVTLRRILSQGVSAAESGRLPVAAAYKMCGWRVTCYHPIVHACCFPCCALHMRQVHPIDCCCLFL